MAAREKYSQYITTFVAILRRFPITFRRFPKISQNWSEGQTNVSEHFPKISGYFPNIIEDFRKRPKEIRRCFDHTSTNLTSYGSANNRDKILLDVKK